MNKVDKLFHIGKSMYQLMPLFHSKIQMNRIKESLHNNGYEGPFNRNHIRTLFLLSKKGDMISSDLGKLIGLERGSVTTLIKCLIKLGYVEKIPCDKDKRKQYLTLSKLGKETVEEINNLYLEEIKYAFEKLDDKEIDRFIESLDTLASIIKKI